MNTTERRYIVSHEWIVRHPVLAWLVLGLSWGLAMGLTFGLIALLLGGTVSALALLGLWLAAGLLFFGPVVVIVNRRQARPH